MTSTADPEYTPAYTLDNAWRAARDRLACLETACDPLTTEHLDLIGVEPGWHCLEVGAGGGSVVRILCDRVGPAGRVLAVDLEPALLAGLERPNLEVRQLDIVVDELPAAAFDLVHARAVLMHIPERAELIPRLVAALRPGGVLLLEEADLTAVFEAGDLFTRTLEAAYRPIVDAGTPMDLRWGATMPGLLEPAGLVDVNRRVERQDFVGGSVLADFYRITFTQYLETFAYTAEERTVLAEGMAALADPGRSFVAWDFVSAWGRRP